MVTTRGMAATGSASAGGRERAAEAMLPLVAASAAEGYEREREARIQENMERMEKLGLRDLANRSNQSATGFAGGGSGSGSDRWKRKVSVTAGPASPSPARRSLRLKSLDPVNYCEIRTRKGKDVEGGSSVPIEVGSEEEVNAEDAAPVAKEDQGDSEAIQDEDADHHQVNDNADDGDEDDRESVVTSSSQDCEVTLEDIIGCATSSEPAGPKKRKLIERKP
uniref:Uncharacterized protein n=1 Tax=Oryza meridionalis TaxID=40149 RepID=A0A0E0D2Z4_9ORYZ